MLSTMHNTDEVYNGKLNKHKELVKKLKLNHDYNMKMGTVDRMDAQVGSYSCVRKSYKWTTKVFLHYVEEAVYKRR